MHDNSINYPLILLIGNFHQFEMLICSALSVQMGFTHLHHHVKCTSQTALHLLKGWSPFAKKLSKWVMSSRETFTYLSCEKKTSFLDGHAEKRSPKTNGNERRAQIIDLVTAHDRSPSTRKGKGQWRITTYTRDEHLASLSCCPLPAC